MKSIKTRLLLLLLPITLALLATIAYINYFKTTEIFTQSVKEYMHTTVNTKQAALVEYIESTEKIGSALAATETMQSYIQLTNRNLHGKNQETRDLLGQRVDDLLRSFQEVHWGRYQHIFLVNRSNRVVVSPGHGAREKGSASPLLDQNLSKNRWAMQAIQKGATTISSFSGRQGSDQDQQTLFFPVRDASNRVQAVIGFELLASHQQQVLARGFSIGKTGRIYLASVKGLPVLHQVIDSLAPLTGTALAEVKLKGSSAERRLNGQGREVFAYYAHQRQYPWILAVEIETAEVFGNLYGLQIILLAGLVATLVAITVLSLTFANAIGRPVRELTAQIERISLGEFNIEIPDSGRKDEIGLLTEALQRLVFSLQLVSKKLRLVKTLKKAS